MKYIILTFTHGSVRTVVDGDTGIEANDYYTFGKRIPLPVSGAVPVTEPAEVTESLEATVASTGSATVATAPTFPNRWLFSGKESQSFLSASIPLLDFGARMYDPTTARWTAQDPLAEKYYAVSPYAYCLGNPISLLDPNGTDVWTVDAFGNVVWKEQSDTHCLYYVDNDGNLSEDYVTVSDRSILDDLTKTEVKTDGGAEVSSHSSKTGINDMFKVFKFASDNTKVEWAIHRNGDTYTIGTGHKTDNAASWEDYVGAMPNAQFIHIQVLGKIWQMRLILWDTEVLSITQIKLTPNRRSISTEAKPGSITSIFLFQEDCIKSDTTMRLS